MQALRKKLLTPVAEFVREESFSGFLLMGVAALAFAWANLSPGSYQDFIHLPLPLGFSLQHFVNDVLMSFFFLVMGHEIKRELIMGELANMRKALLPILAAVGGMVAPALIYAGFALKHPEAQHGWGIPMATDIAFALGVLSLLGSRIPAGLKVFLLTLAIVDDLGAVLVIALFYTANLTLSPLLASFAVYALIAFLVAKRKMPRIAFFALGALAWYGIFRSGVHATIGGVILGLLAPVDNETTTHGIMPQMKWLHHLIAFVIMPIFALTNAGVELGSISLATGAESAVFYGVLLGLFLGKPIGIFVASRLAVRAGQAELPSGVNWRHLAGAGCLGGIGFTMALFVSSLSFKGDSLASLAKVAILSGSFLSAVLGYGVLMQGPQRAQIGR